ncbi:MAG: hypothetical protein HY465_05375 [Deltaproteobacteria bacterium]|nr:hypothetical protein [Deltaproteobacteria bacterium]
MPCNDVTDRLKVTLDGENRLVTYTLAKRTCGAEVGDYSLIEDWAKFLTAEEIIETPADHFLDTKRPHDDAEEFLFLKHYFSLKNGLEAVMGLHAADGDDARCTIDKVEYGPDGLTFLASIKLDIITNQIKSCGGCSRGCGSKSRISS